MSETEAWTIGRLLRWTTDFLKQRGSVSPRLDAEVLLAAARRCERIQLYTAFDEVLTDDVRAQFRDLVKRRGEGEPVAYLVGQREFFSLPFQVNRHVLIPRPETEFVVLTLLDAVKQRGPQQPLQIADVGTGSGILAVCAAKHILHCHVLALDISAEALAVARANAETHGVADRIEFIESDLFSAAPARRFDFIVSNPPYFSAAELQALAKDVAGFEPPVALLGGETGTEVIARLVQEAASRLEAGGELMMEISPMIQGQVRALIGQHTGYGPPRTVKDLAGLPRVIVTQKTP